MFIVLMILMVPFRGVSIFKDSTLLNTMINKTPVVSKLTSNITNTIVTTYELAEDISKENITVNDANLKIIDNMLNYKIVSKKTVEQLVVLDKLKEVSNLDSILNKYE